MAEVEGNMDLAVAILPEVWELIFDQLGNRKDVRNCYNTCSTFRFILGPRRPVFLFKDVFSDFLLKHLSKDDVFNCRKVCKQWALAVDKYFRHPPHHLYAHNFERLPGIHSSWRRWAANRYTFEGLTKIQDYLSERIDWYSAQNVFITGEVIFDDSALNSNEANEFWSLAVAIVEKFGFKIYFLRLTNANLGWLYFYENVILRMTSCTPNLVGVSMVNDNRDEAFRNHGRNWREECVRFESLLEAHPLPKLEKLWELRVKYFPSECIHYMFERWGSPEITCLMMSPIAPERARFDYSGVGRLFPNLDEIWFPAPTMNCLRTLAATYPDNMLPLEWIGVTPRVSEETYPNHITFHRLFNYLGDCYGTTLRVLDMIINGNATLDGGFTNRNLRLHLPNLESLTIKITVDQVQLTSLDFMEPLKKLTNFSLSQTSWHFDEMANLRTAIQFAGYAFRMQESNIWQKLPELNFLFLGNNEQMVGSYSRIMKSGQVVRWGLPAVFNIY